MKPDESPDHVVMLIDIAAACGIGLCLIDTEYRYSWVNAAFAEILGYPREELIGKSFVDITHPDDVDADVALSAQAFERKVPYFTMQKRFIRGDRTLLVGNLVAGFAFDLESNPIGGFAVLTEELPSNSADGIDR